MPNALNGVKIMTAEEHIISWIESSQPHYRRLLKLYEWRLEQ